MRKRIGMLRVAQGLAQFHHSRVQAVVKIYKGVGAPQRFAQFLARYDLTGAFDEPVQHLRGLGLKTHQRAVAPQFPGACVEFIQAESEAGWFHHSAEIVAQFHDAT